MKNSLYPLSICLLSFLIYCSLSCNDVSSADAKKADGTVKDEAEKKQSGKTESIDTADYNKKMLALANSDTTGRWPAKTPLPLPGAIFPYNRVVAFYGNLYSKRMGILGEIPKDSMFKKLQGEIDKWKKADSLMPVIPALHYIAVSAQGSPGKDGKHRMRMPFHQVDTIMNWAKQINALVFLDIQVGASTVKDEVPQLEKYLQLPNVHLGIDPEFSMKNGETPGSKIGTFNSDDINAAIDYLAAVVTKNNLPPKILIVHRFTQGMITGYEKIKKLPEVQVVMDMDGWGDKTLKRSTYLRYIYREPVMFTGFKLFYKNDTKKDKDGIYNTRMKNYLKFTPKPIYIQYQ